MEDTDHETEKVFGIFDHHIETGFQLAAFQGPLCSEPVEGMAYFVENVEIDGDALGKEIGRATFMFVCQFP